MIPNILKRKIKKQQTSSSSICNRKNSTQYIPDMEFIFMPRLESQLPNIPSRSCSTRTQRRPHIPFLIWNHGLENKKVTLKENKCSKGKKKCEELNENKEESEGERVNYVNGEKADFISFIAREGNGACEKVLENMTKCMTREERLGFMESLEGEWLGACKRRKVVNAAVLVNFFPIDWKIEISIRRRVDLITFYCRKYVSPSGMEFKTCTEVARHLRAQSLIDVSGPSKKGEMGQINNGSCMLPKSQIDEVPNSFHQEVTNNLPGTNDLYDVKIASFIDCYPCGLKFEDMGGLEKHLASFHNKTTRRLNLPNRDATQRHTFEKMDPYQYAVTDHHEPQLDQVRSLQNGQASSASHKIAEEVESVPIVNANSRFMTTCTWCNRKFLCGPVDAETMAEAAGYMCPKCQKKACGVFETLKGD